jgi:glyoxylase-like metal-dependent hydrolase (beta-lactamase superfamily II)/rhodanese-related sulfurtransferase
MKVIPFVHEGLGNSSYLVDLGEGEAAIVDPDRTTARYLAAAEAHGWRIVAVIETHLHADFVSGVTQLGVDGVPYLLLPEAAEARFPHQPLVPGTCLRLGKREVEVIASPGHTPEHLSYVIRGPAGAPALFSGGSLLVGGAARTDLIDPEQTDALTRAQYRTLTRAFATLPDETRLYPTHGGGSFCSAGGGHDRTSTLGRERATNPLLAYPNEEMFAREFPATFPAAPDYFFRMRAVNQAGPRLLGEIPPPPPLDPAAFDAVRSDALVVDARPKEDYARSHIAGAISIPFRDAYATWLGWLVPPEMPLLLVTDGVALERVVEESLLVGYERLAGWLASGMNAWHAAGLPVATTALVDSAAARAAVLDGAVVVDVREPDEFAAGHIEGARHMPLGSLPSTLSQLPRDRPILAYCGHGERATTALSLLEQAGFSGPLLNLDNGFGAWEERNEPG